jgi:hypothetical protein
MQLFGYFLPPVPLQNISEAFKTRPDSLNIFIYKKCEEIGEIDLYHPRMGPYQMNKSAPSNVFLVV